MISIVFIIFLVIITQSLFDFYIAMDSPVSSVPTSVIVWESAWRMHWYTYHWIDGRRLRRSFYNLSIILILYQGKKPLMFLFYFQINHNALGTILIDFYIPQYNSLKFYQTINNKLLYKNKNFILNKILCNIHFWKKEYKHPCGLEIGDPDCVFHYTGVYRFRISNYNTHNSAFGDITRA